MSLLTQSDLENGENFNGQLLYRKLKQAIRNKATEMQLEDPTTPERQAFATMALENPNSAMQRIIPYVLQNSVIQTAGGEATDNDILFVLHDPTTGVIPTRYPLP